MSDCPSRTGPLSGILPVFLLAVSVLVAEEKPSDPNAEPLEITAENTIIIDNSGYAGRTLQHYLVKYFGDEKEAGKYQLDSRVDRTASPHFPLFRKKPGPEHDGKIVLAVGRTGHLTPEDRARINAKTGSILISRRGKVVVIAGSGDPWNGNFTAASTFLNICAGVRFYAPGDLWTSRPKSQTITIRRLSLFRKPYFAKTAWSWSKRAGLTQWFRMNRSISEGSNLRASHTLARIFPPAKHYEAHPEIYEMKDGKRPKPQGGAWNPCLSAKALPDLAMDHVRGTMKDRKRSYLSFGVMDCAFDCECPGCQKSVKEHNGSYSNLYYTFLNQVAKQCQEEFPALYLTSYVYSNVRRPPVGMRIEPNIVLDITGKTYHWVNPGWVASRKAWIKTWSDLGASWMLHDWSFSGVSPREYMRQYALFLQWAAQNGMAGIYVEWSPGEGWYLDGAKYWILAQLMSDPYQDADLLWKRYCDDMFGSASETMFRFFRQFSDRFLYSDNYISRADWPRQEPAMYSPEEVAYQRSLLERAIAKTKEDANIQKRLDAIMRYFRCHELFALASYMPHRLDFTFKGEGVNKAALAYYVNEEGNELAEAIEYHAKKRTIPPDSNEQDMRAGVLVSYVNNATRAKAKILLAIREQAMEQVDLAEASRETVKELISKAKQVLRENLPEKYREDKVKEFESLLEKFVWVPTLDELPKLDGNLSDPVWAKATALTGFSERDSLIDSVHKTEGKIMRVKDKLVVGFTLHQQGEIWARTTPDIETGTRIWRESGTEFFFGALPKEEEKATFAQYIVNALGAWRGFRNAKDNREGVEVGVKLDKEKGFYTIEAAFPLKAKGYDYTGEKVLSFNIMRNVFHADTFGADVLIGWYPIFYTAGLYQSRGLIFME